MNNVLESVSPAIEAGLVLSGSCGYRIDNDRVLVQVDGIANNRGQGDLSGTLAVELWALDGPYSGGDFEGIGLAATLIGEVAGQYRLSDCRYDLLFCQPPAGTWHLTLMLREWTGAGYQTRDFVNFAIPYRVPARAAVVSVDGDKVINVDFGADKTINARSGGEPEARPRTESGPVVDRPATAPEAVVHAKDDAPATANAPAEPAVTKAAAPVEPAAKPQAEPAATKPAKTEPAKTEPALSAKPAAKPQAEVAATRPAAPAKPAAAKAAAPVKPAKSPDKAAAKRHGVSLNKGSLVEIAALQGVSKRVAEAIIAARPFQAVDELLRVKGVGVRLLQRLRAHVRL